MWLVGKEAGEKSEKPTAQKLKQAKKDGQVARTQELGAWGAMMIAAVLLPGVYHRGYDKFAAMWINIEQTIRNPDPAMAIKMLASGAWDGVTVVGPFVLTMMLFGIAASVAQGGVHLSAKKLKPDFKKFNLLKGLKKTFGPQAGWEAVKALLKTAVVAGVLWMTVRKLAPTLILSGSLPLSAVVDTISAAMFTLIRSAAAAGLVMAVADFAVQKKRINKQLKMTKQEVKTENKNTEGDPHLKGAIRSKQMAMSRNRMMSEIADADVVIVNPTHIAVALRYDPVKGAPRIVAKGSGAIATKIRERAMENRIPIVQDIPLARTLHKACTLGQEIPAEMYSAVARVLAFVMALKTKGSAAGEHRNPNPTPMPTSMPTQGARRRAARAARASANA